MKGNLCAGPFGHLSDFVIICRDNNAVKTTAFDRVTDGPEDHWFAAKSTDVLARDPFAPHVQA